MELWLTICSIPSHLQAVSAVIQEDEFEVSLTVSFVSAARGEQVCLPHGPKL